MNLKSYSKLDISIVIGANENFIIPCLKSIYKNYKHSANIYVTSNLSSQLICKKIQKIFPCVHIIENTVRKGFAENHNNVIEKTNGEYILILNDDTVILDQAIKKLINYLDMHPDVAVISPKLLNPNLSLQQSTYSFPSLFTSTLNLLGIRKMIPFNNLTYRLISIFYKKGQSRFWEHDKICKVDTFRGACMMARRDAVKNIGLMDEVSLAYGEETEWHYRFKKKGWEIVFYPEAEVIHYGKQTTKKQALCIEEEKIKGLLNFYRKHKSKFSYYFLRVIIIFTFFFRYVFSLITLNRKTGNLYLHIIKIAQNPEEAFRGKRTFY